MSAPLRIPRVDISTCVSVAGNVGYMERVMRTLVVGIYRVKEALLADAYSAVGHTSHECQWEDLFGSAAGNAI
eukprot:1089425-Amphidinium_carterae.1